MATPIRTVHIYDYEVEKVLKQVLQRGVTSQWDIADEIAQHFRHQKGYSFVAHPEDMGKTIKLGDQKFKLTKSGSSWKVQEI